MRFDIVTIFPEFFAGPLDYGIVRRAREAELIEARVHDLREFTHDRHRTVDDRPFGGGEGMVMKPEPLFEAVESLVGERDAAVGVGALHDQTEGVGVSIREQHDLRCVVVGAGIQARAAGATGAAEPAGAAAASQ